REPVEAKQGAVPEESSATNRGLPREGETKSAMTGKRLLQTRTESENARRREESYTRFVEVFVLDVRFGGNTECTGDGIEKGFICTDETAHAVITEALTAEHRGVQLDPGRLAHGENRIAHLRYWSGNALRASDCTGASEQRGS